ncbi:unnamed protein product [Diamesa tonsa]
MKKIAVAIRYRIFFAILLLIAVWIIYSNFSDYSRNRLLEDEFEFARKKGVPVNVAVYYEVLCPDSKNFIIKQLQASYIKAPKLIEIEFFPYGKATTNTNSDGSLSFDCQHGPTECEGNMIHACSIEAIHDTKTRLDMVACMIRDNRNPKESFNRCSKEYTIDVETIQKCYSGLHGAELLKIAGQATDALRPKATFIPTVTLDGQQFRQASILKDLLHEVCKVATGNGPPPKVCEGF